MMRTDNQAALVATTKSKTKVVESNQTTAWFVGRKRSITELSPEKREQVRKAYKDTGFAHNDSEEGICICLTEEKARAACEGKLGWFYYELPIEECLPEEAVDFSGTHFPSSDKEVIPLDMRVINVNDEIAVQKVAIESLSRASERERHKQEVMKSFMIADIDCDS